MFYCFLQGLAVLEIIVVLIAYIGEEFGRKTMARRILLYVADTVLGGFPSWFLPSYLSK
ncbi:hypothetical protein [Neisseria musculi]|uniref:Membrane protein n=1 Tax=Neisseria musculi TaxID=1815583 RepID=A0A7H1MFF6_9NEIS|nr:putative membrane protein [Neisseria musculi]